MVNTADQRGCSQLMSHCCCCVPFYMWDIQSLLLYYSVLPHFQTTFYPPIHQATTDIFTQNKLHLPKCQQFLKCLNCFCTFSWEACCCCIGVENIPWLGNVEKLCPASLVPPPPVSPGPPQTLPHFPVRPGEKRSYAQSCVVWIKDTGLQVSVLCILISADMSTTVDDLPPHMFLQSGINQNTQEIKNERFLISTRQNNVRIVSIRCL